MTYRITGLDAAPFKPLYELSDDELAQRNARRVTVTNKPGFPCRVTLEDADKGEEVILLHHVSHDVDTPYRSAYAIYVRGGASEAASFVDQVPPAFEGRPLAFRGFDSEGMLRGACWSCRVKPTPKSVSCSSVPRWRPFTPTTPPTVASRRKSRGTDHGHACQRDHRA